MGFLCSDDHLQETLSDAISNFHVMQHMSFVGCREQKEKLMEGKQ